MASKTLDYGAFKIKVTYTTWTEYRYYVVSIDRVSYVSGAADVDFDSTSPYMVSYSGEWYNSQFRISNVHDPDNHVYNYLDTNTKIRFDRYTGSTSDTDAVITFHAWFSGGGHLTRSLNVQMPALKSYTVSYFKGSISGSVYGLPSDQYKFQDIDLTLSSDKPTSNYGTFQHWNTRSNDSGTTYNSGARYTNNDYLNLYAVWQLYTYQVSYNANGGSNAPSSQTKTAGIDITLSSQKPTKNYYLFKYWNTNQNGTGINYYSGQVYSRNEAITLYAIWIPEEYKIRYDANGGSNAPTSQVKVAGETLTLTESIPTRTGYTFKKWNTDSGGGGTNYNPGASYTRNEPMTLYAIWEPEKYTITFNANGGTSAPSNKTKTYGETLYLPDSTPRRTGYTFSYWSTGSDGGGYTYVPGEAFDLEGNYTLYAQWDLIYYTITYESQNEYYGTRTQSKPYGETVKITSWAPSAHGYTFDRWNTNSSGTGTNYKSGDNFTKNENITLYAIISPNQSTVYYDANGGSGAPESQTMIYDQDIRVPSTIPVRSGYTFAGWSWDQTVDEYSIIYQPGDYLDSRMDVNITFYAVWMPGIFYDANGGSGAPTVQIIFDTDPITLSSVIPVRDNHTFLYWNTNRNGTGTTYNPGATYTPVNTVDNVFLYAIWRRDPDPPTISAMLVTRRNSSNALDDEGTYMHISVTWNVDTVRRSGNKGKCVLYYKLSSDISWTKVLTSAYATSATTTKLISNISTDEQYDVKAEVTDYDSRVTTRLDLLTRAKFVWDIAVGGEAMGIGSAAPSDGGLEIGWHAQLDEDVVMLKNLRVLGTITALNSIVAPNFDISNTTDGIIQSSTYWTVSGQVAYLFGPICSINITLAPSRTYQIGEVNEIVATLGTAYRPIVAHSFGTYWGLGYINTQGQIHFQNYQVISDSSQLQIGLTFIRQQT